jgi:hypothetical protein
MGETLIAASSQIGTLSRLCRCLLSTKPAEWRNRAYAEGRFPVRLNPLLVRHKDGAACDIDEPDALGWRLRPRWCFPPVLSWMVAPSRSRRLTATRRPAALRQLSDRPRGQHRNDRGGLGGVAVECVHHQREPAHVSQQPDGDLRLEPALLGEPWLPEPITFVGLEVQGADVVQHQGGWAEPDMISARRRQRLPPLLGGVTGRQRLIVGYYGAGTPISTSTRIESSLLVGWTTLASTSCWETSSPRARSNPKTP